MKQIIPFYILIGFNFFVIGMNPTETAMTETEIRKEILRISLKANLEAHKKARAQGKGNVVYDFSGTEAGIRKVQKECRDKSNEAVEINRSNLKIKLRNSGLLFFTEIQ